jgi:alanine racemase
MGIELVATPGLNLQPVVRFETSISSLHHVPANEGVGYGFEDAATHPRTLATLPVGYADGFPRNLSNGRGAVTIRGQQARVVGKVCMDLVMVDVSHIPKAAVGDSVEIFGQHQRIEEFAAAAETIPYEILTRIPGRVAREQRGN